MKDYSEIHFDDNGKQNEIVMQCDSVHIERMSSNYWRIGIYRGGKRVTFNIVKRGESTDCELVENEPNL